MRLLRVLASALALAACAPEIVRQPTQLTPVTEQAGGTIEILEDTSILVGPAGYRRVIGRGSVWTRIGRVVEGEICGHLPTLEQPELVTAALRDWLGEVSPDVRRRGDDDEHA